VSEPEGSLSTSTSAREGTVKPSSEDSKQAAANKTKGFCQPPPYLGVARTGVELCSTDKWGALAYSFSSGFYNQVHLFVFFCLDWIL
jgi:hypothetical protein